LNKAETVLTKPDPFELSLELEVFDSAAALFKLGAGDPKVVASNRLFDHLMYPAGDGRLKPVGPHELGVIQLMLETCFGDEGIRRGRPVLCRCRSFHAALSLFPILADDGSRRVLSVQRASAPESVEVLEAPHDTRRTLRDQATMRLTQIAGGIAYLGEQKSSPQTRAESYDALSRACESVLSVVRELEKSLYPRAPRTSQAAKKIDPEEMGDVASICLALPSPPCGSCGVENCPISARAAQTSSQRRAASGKS